MPMFFNEYGGAVISTTFDKYCYVNVRHLPPFMPYYSELCYSRFERVNTLDEIEHPAIREAMKMRSEAKRIEAEIKKISVEYSNGGITVVAKGDMSIGSISIAPEAYDEVKAGKPARFETMLFNVVNGALKKVREATQQQMARLMQENGGMGGLFGK